MRHASRRSCRLVVPALMVLTGCFSLGRESPALEFYTLAGALPAQDGAATAPAAGRAGVTIGVRRLGLASYLATPSIVVRQGANRIHTSDYHRWAGDVGEGIVHAFVAHLAGSRGVHSVDRAPFPVRATYDFLVQLHIARFEGATADADTLSPGASHVLATWEIVRQSDDAILARGVTEVREPGWTQGDYAALVARLNQGLEVVAGQVAACLARVPAAPADPAAAPSAIACGGEPVPRA